MDSLLEHGSYFGIFLFLVLTGCGLPIPEEVPIVFAGVLSAQGELMVEWAFAACLLGAILGDSAMYAIGYHFGHGLLSSHPKIGKFLGAEREEYFEQAILRHGFKVMLLSRFMVGVRGPVYLAAGVVRIPYRKFLLWDAICATLVVSTFFGLSYVFGREIGTYIRDAERALTLLVVATLLIAILWWLRRRRRAKIEAIMQRENPANHGPHAQNHDEQYYNHDKNQEDVA